MTVIHHGPTTGESNMKDVRTEADSFGPIEVPADKLWGAQTERSLEHFSIGQDLIPREMITAYAILKRAAAAANHAGGRLPDQAFELITHVCDEILAGQHHNMFPLGTFRPRTRSEPHTWSKCDERNNQDCIGVGAT